MANTATALYQKRGVNHKTTVVQIAVSGNYAQGGEAVNLSASALLNPNAKAITGPNLSFPLPPKVAAQSLGGYTATVTPTGSECNAKIQFWNGDTELAAGAYPDVIANGTLTLELDHDLGS